jgi:hypothetical protein
LIGTMRFLIGSRLVPVHAPTGTIPLHLAPTGDDGKPSSGEAFEEALDET